MHNYNFKTKKSAREAGLKTREEWIRHFPAMVPRPDANGLDVKGESFYSIEECEELVSKTEAERRGLRVPPDAVPVTQKYSRGHGKSFHYDMFRTSDCAAKRKLNARSPVAIDLLLAVFTVNKSAKRFRDAASSNYSLREHGFAKAAKLKKEKLYELKQRGIARAFEDGRLQYCGIHGRLGIYRGEGYCFHSLLVPRDADTESAEDESRIFVEAAPKGATEARLKDACFTLESCGANEQLFVRHELPKQRKRGSGLRRRGRCCK